MPSRPDGACIHLTPDNLCAIYDTRPDQCRVPPTRADHALQAAYCNAFQALTGTPDSYRVVLDDPAPDD